MSLSLVLLFGAGTRAMHADEPSDAAAQKAKKLIAAECRMILLVAHPTGKLTTLACREQKNEGVGFKLSFNFGFSGLFGDETTQLHFKFDPNGRFLACEPGATTSIARPFEAASLAIDVVRDYALKEINKLKDDPDSQYFKTLIAQAETYIREANARGLMELYLKVRQRKMN